MFRNAYPSIETGAVVMFALALLAAARRGRRPVIELCSAVIYGLLLEQGDILIFGSYKYSHGFSLVLFDVPVAIALCWAVIISGCMRVSDDLGLPASVAPAADALLALGLDFAFDAVAIRQGLWHWNIGLSQAYFGVPAGNFYAWLFVAFGFSYLTRRLRARPSVPLRIQALVPIGAYGTLLLAMLPFVALRRLVFTGPGSGMPAVAVVAVVFALAVALSWRRRQPPRGAGLFALASRIVFHGYFLIALLDLGIYRQAPVLLGVSLALLAADLVLAAALVLRPAMRARSAAPAATVAAAD